MIYFWKKSCSLGHVLMRLFKSMILVGEGSQLSLACCMMDAVASVSACSSIL